MPQLFTNNARALLASGVTDTATSLTVEASKADLFPTANTGTASVPSANNWFKATIQDSAGNTEIVYVRTRTSGSGIFSNVLRGQEGTTARTFSAGAVVGLRLTALDVQQSINVLSNNNVFTGTATFAGAVTFNQTTTFNQAATFAQPAIFAQTATFNNATGFNQPATFSALSTFNQLATFVADPRIRNIAPTLFMQDTNGMSAMIHCEGNKFYVLRGGVDSQTWEQVNGFWPLTLDLADNSMIAGGDIAAAGNISASSDIRLKRDLNVIPHALDKVRSLTGYTFTRIDTGVRQTGLVAQEVEKVLPEAVMQGEYLSVAYGNLVGLLVEAIKELETEVSKLKGA